MRTIIDITDEQVKALDEISQLEGTSRAALIRQAIDRMLVEDARVGEAAQAAFGLWSDRKKDGLEIEAMLRRGKVVTTSPAVVAKAPEPTTIPEPVAELVEDRFVVTEEVAPTEAATEEEPVVTKLPDPPKPIARSGALSSADPLSAFFAGVKS
jgi:hypothetical protein